ncbi:MAG: HEPN domain-containing protein [Candidatus Helarchaeota archaeon]
MTSDEEWWYNTAKRDLLMAQTLYKISVKTHSCVQILKILKRNGIDGSKIISCARKLDIHYIPSRYPNGLGGEPETFYDKKISSELLECATEILDFVEAQINVGSERGG